MPSRYFGASISYSKYYTFVNPPSPNLYVLPHKWQNNFTIRVSLEMVWDLESFSNDPVVINLAVDGQGNGFILVGEWLRSTFNSHNAQTLVCENYGA